MPISREDLLRIKQNIKIQQSISRNGKTPHIRDTAKHRARKLMEKLREKK
jgi:hypothetical protein